MSDDEDDALAIAESAAKFAAQALGEAAAGRALAVHILVAIAAAARDPEATLGTLLAGFGRVIAITARADPGSPVLAAMEISAERIDAAARRTLAALLRRRASAPAPQRDGRAGP